MIIYGVDGEHGNDSNSGIITVVSENPLVIDWSNARKNIVSAFDLITSNETALYIRGQVDDESQLIYNIPDGQFKNINNIDNYDLVLMNDNEYLEVGKPVLIRGVGNIKPRITGIDSGNVNLICAGSGFKYENIDFYNVDIIQSYLIQLSTARRSLFKNCDFYGNDRVIFLYNRSHKVFFDTCYFYSENQSTNFNFGTAMADSTVFFKDCSTNSLNMEDPSDGDNIYINSFNNIKIYTHYNKIYKSCFLNGDFSTYFSATNSRFLLFKSILKNLSKYPRGSAKFINNTIIISDIMNIDNSVYCEFKNSIIWSDSEINWVGNTDKVKFENCIARNFPVGAELINCITTDDIKFVDPSTDDYSLQQDSPARKVNWTGESPITEDIGAIPYTYKPLLYTVYVIGNSGKIPLFIGIRDDNKIIELEIMYSIDEGETWNDCSIDYNTGVFGTAGETDIINDFLWNTAIDVPGIADTILRIRGYDGNEYSDYIYSSPIPIDNINIIPDVKWMTPLKFKLEDDKKLYFRMKRERD